MITALRHWWWRRRRCELAAKGGERASEAWLSWLRQPLPSPGARFEDIDWLVIDTETTGVGDDAEIISLGWVPLRGGRVILGEAVHVLVRSDMPVGHSATVHRLTDSDVDAGMPLSEAIAQLGHAAQGHWPVFHGAPLDVRLLSAALASQQGLAFPPPWVDTLQLEKRRRERRDRVIGANGLQLDTLRSAYQLPPHTPHDALSDAIATAELFSAQALHNGRNRQATAADVWDR